jgi:hypothetical protein
MGHGGPTSAGLCVSSCRMMSARGLQRQGPPAPRPMPRGPRATASVIGVIGPPDLRGHRALRRLDRHHVAAIAEHRLVAVEPRQRVAHRMSTSNPSARPPCPRPAPASRRTPPCRSAPPAAPPEQAQATAPPPAVSSGSCRNVPKRKTLSPAPSLSPQPACRFDHQAAKRAADQERAPHGDGQGLHEVLDKEVEGGRPRPPTGRCSAGWPSA